MTAQPRSREPEAAGGSRTDSSSVHGRFEPGTRLGSRYRIVGLLGRGGMGEVYRADDLELGQTVALKFLPERLTADAAALARFRNEVRTARQIAHPNVCRIYDIAQQDGHVFLSMEYIDGEDLAGVLRRLRHPSREKAVEIARQICLGLAAAHENKVLHRDLKPANVMIDGRGRARITDFGLAGLADELDAQRERVGTPAYMAPEQLTHGKVSTRSDIYALGLVLHELFTGKRVFDTNDIEELKRKHASGTLSTSAFMAEEIDPAVERVIMRCLEPQPERRPQSIYQVLAALPGGDPLAAALEAGETPSPDMVAAAGEVGLLRPTVAATLLLSVVAGLVACVFTLSKVRLVERVDLPEPPQVLAKQARDAIRALGHNPSRGYNAYGLEYNAKCIRFAATGEPERRWLANPNENSPPLLQFWYRESERPLLATRVNMRYEFRLVQAGRVSPTDPPLTAGMVAVVLDPHGRLLEFVSPPGESEVHNEADDSMLRPEWTELLRLCGVAPAEMSASRPSRIPPVFCDSRAAWDGIFPGTENVPLHIEAGAVAGKVVWVRTFGPWDDPRILDVDEFAASIASASAIDAIYVLTLIGICCLLAVRNYRLGRSDRSGALRLAVFVFASLTISWALSADHSISVGDETWFLLLSAVAKHLFWAGFLWALYLALEPYVRRRWPERIISWSRLLAGRWRDPLVGRDVLIGIAVGVVSVAVLTGVNDSFRKALGLPGYLLTETTDAPLSPLLGVRFVGAAVAGATADSIRLALVFLISPLIVQMLVRNLGVAASIAWLVLTAFSFLSAGMGTAWSFVYFGAWIALFLVVAIRLGLLTCTATWFSFLVLSTLPITADLSNWYASESTFGLLLLGGLASVAFYISLAGQPIFKDLLAQPQPKRQSWG